ncbi:hypothetical protein K502DRAFT_325185 [Neoconidiobolus thromboides FSU 785]|nr:hypothetical protein K502DRAFT_325185 [Neoconidiobolus thromboides FSU 785]
MSKRNKSQSKSRVEIPAKKNRIDWEENVIEDCLEGWKRKPAKKINEEEDFTFQQLQIDEASDDKDSKKHLIRMYGITKEGNSVLCKVRNFLPYLYFPAPIGMKSEDLPECKKALETGLNDFNSVYSVEIVYKKSIMHYYSEGNHGFIKVTLMHQRFISKVRALLGNNSTGLQFNKYQIFNTNTFESGIEYLLRFMIDQKVSGGNWITLPKGKYKIENENSKISTCQYELNVNYNNFISHLPENEWSDIAPLRVLSFDIECKGRKGVFPEAKIDPVIQIGNIIKRQGELEPFISVIFCLKQCAPIAGSQVLSFEDERSLLLAWSKFINISDPDLIIGYNTSNFDFTYLLERAQALDIEDFPYFGRIINRKSVAENSHFSSKAYGSRDTKVINIEGRLQLDMLQVMNREYKLRSYSLNSVSEHFLKETKEDVHYSIISELQEDSAETRRRLAVYCLKDAYLPLRLMDKLMVFINYLEMARVTGVPFGYILTRGQQIKVVSQLYRKANEKGYLIPFKDSNGPAEDYEGATVIDPQKGYYKEPIATLDFASLYPSIMMAHNLCYSTLIIDKSIVDKQKLIVNEDYILTPNNMLFIKNSKRKGILPIILEELIQARKIAKRDLKKETDPFKRAVLDGRQLALKITANSVYGFTGASNGKLPCLDISATVTAYGRSMINETAALVKKKFPESNVIYGDTDSVMVDFKVTNIAEAMELGKQAAEYVSSHFIKPISLEFEKVYCPYLLINKKRYAGVYWSNPNHYDKLDAKGIETVRRDSCQLVSTLIGNCLNKAMIDRDVQGAVNYAKQAISDLLKNKIDMSLLVITKTLSKTDYVNAQPHEELAKKMRIRDSGSAPTLGDRVAYVIVEGEKGSNISDRSEDPLYVLEQGLTIDSNFYMENQIKKPLLRIFEPILGEQKANEIFLGEHTRDVVKRSKIDGLFGKFITKKNTCLSCKKEVGKDNKATCEGCKEKVPDIYQEEIRKSHELQIRHSRLWTECQRCKGSLLTEIQCASSDCPIFYMRTKATKDVKKSLETLDRFDYEW